MSTVASIIEQYNTERPNTTPDDLKVGWLKKCEQMLITETLMSHEHDLEDESRQILKVKGNTLYITSAGSFVEHIDTFDMATELYAPEPYDDLYIFYLDQRIAYLKNDEERYNMATTQYNNALLVYQQYVNRTYTPKKEPKKLFNHSNL